MASLQIGNRLGLPARGTSQLLATATADGANIVTIASAEIKNLRVGMTIEIITKATGVSKGVRNIIILDSSTGNVWYDGADIAVTVADGIYRPGSWAGPPTNLNGGASVMAGLIITGQISLEDMRSRLKAINPTYYTDTRLDQLTDNDIVYALRLADASASV